MGLSIQAHRHDKRPQKWLKELQRRIKKRLMGAGLMRRLKVPRCVTGGDGGNRTRVRAVEHSATYMLR